MEGTAVIRTPATLPFRWQDAVNFIKMQHRCILILVLIFGHFLKGRYSRIL